MGEIPAEGYDEFARGAAAKTKYEIPEEAVEAARRALDEGFRRHGQRMYALEEALTAAIPFLRQQWEQERDGPEIDSHPTGIQPIRRQRKSLSEMDPRRYPPGEYRTTDPITEEEIGRMK